MRHLLFGFAGIAVVAAGAAVGLYGWMHVTPSVPGEHAHVVPRPTLYCDFYNFMRSATVVSFYFVVDTGAGGQQKYSELYVVENEGEKTDFGGPDQPPSPRWSYSVEDGTPTIASPDGETRIVLYGLKPKLGGVFWVEAGVRSNSYRNLEGKCRQAHYVATSTNAKT